jgi:SAM-dependent methyltransferase
MSSPIAKPSKSAVDRALIAAHQRVSHHRRIELLADALSARIRALPSSDNRTVRVLDVGCGDMRLADAMASHLGDASISCTDIHPCPPGVAASDPRWQRYVQFDGRQLPFAASTFDVAIFCDVLHHVPEALRPTLLASAARAARYVLVKDHFEYGWASRQILRAMDWFGNASYGVSVPRRYFDRSGFADLCASAGVEALRLDIGFDLYNHLPGMGRVLRRDWHFFAICRASSQAHAAKGEDVQQGHAPASVA